MQEMLGSLATYGYIILFFYSFGGGMIALIAAGILSASGELNIAICVIVAGIANFIGDDVIFYLSRYYKKEFSPYIAKQRRNLALSQVLFKKYGSAIIFLKKYIYGLKTLIPIAIALTNFSFLKFNIINAISSAIWAISVGMASFYAGNFMVKFYENNPWWILPLFLGVLVISIIIYFKKATARKI